MSTPATDRLNLALGRIQEEMLQLERNATKADALHREGYAHRFGYLHAAVRSRLLQLDAALAAAIDAAHDVRNPCTHEFGGCMECDEEDEEARP